MKKYILFILIGLTMASCNKEEKEREEKREQILKMFTEKIYESDQDDPYIIKFGKLYDTSYAIYDIDSNYLAWADGSCVLNIVFGSNGFCKYRLSVNNDEIEFYDATIDVPNNRVYYSYFKSYGLNIIDNKSFELIEDRNTIHFNYISDNTQKKQIANH